MSIIENFIYGKSVSDIVDVILVCDLERVGGHFYEDKVTKKHFSVKRTGTLELDGIRIFGETEKRRFSQEEIVSLRDHEEDNEDTASSYRISNVWLESFYDKVAEDYNGTLDRIKTRKRVRRMLFLIEIIFALITARVCWFIHQHGVTNRDVVLIFFITYMIGLVLIKFATYKVRKY